MLILTRKFNESLLTGDDITAALKESAPPWPLYQRHRLEKNALLYNRPALLRISYLTRIFNLSDSAGTAHDLQAAIEHMNVERTYQ